MASLNPDDATLTDAALTVQELIRRAPAGGLFHDATIGPVRSLFDSSGAIREATFPVFVKAGVVWDVTLTAHRDI